MPSGAEFAPVLLVGLCISAEVDASACGLYLRFLLGGFWAPKEEKPIAAAMASASAASSASIVSGVKGLEWLDIGIVEVRLVSDEGSEACGVSRVW